MNVYLVRSPEVEEKFYRSVVDFLKSFSGPVNFFSAEEYYPKEDPIGHVCCSISSYEMKHFPNLEKKRRGPDVIPWKKLFSECQSYREEYSIEENDYLFMLTSRPNENNWFSAYDRNNKRNSFIHTADWDKFISSDALYPVAYEVAVGAFHTLLIKDYDNLEQHTHFNPIGCMNDFCKDKRDIALKLRTGDICHECLEKLEASGVDPTEIEQILNILEGIRKQVLFHNNFSRGYKVSRLVVNRFGSIVLIDYGNRIINLTPLEKTLLIFYLRHEDGCGYSDLVDYETELLAIYSKLSNSGSKEEMKRNIHRLVDMREGSVREKVSKIKRAFVDTIGPRLAEYYFIKLLPSQKHGITLDRKNVTYEL